MKPNVKKGMSYLLTIAGKSILPILLFLAQASCVEQSINANAPIVITARIRVKPDCVKAFKQIGETIIAETRKEEGCRIYYLLQDVQDSCRFCFYEEYANEEAVSYHRSQPYLETFKQQREPMLSEKPDAIIYTIANKQP